MADESDTAVRMQLAEFLAGLPKQADGEPRLSHEHLGLVLAMAGVRRSLYFARRSRGSSVLDSLSPRRRRA